MDEVPGWKWSSKAGFPAAAIFLQPETEDDLARLKTPFLAFF